jgi:hypothetical protein
LLDSGGGPFGRNWSAEAMSLEHELRRRPTSNRNSAENAR